MKQALYQIENTFSIVYLTLKNQVQKFDKN